MSVEDKVKSIIAEQLEVDIAGLTLETLSKRSMRFTGYRELVMALEEFEQEIPTRK